MAAEQLHAAVLQRSVSVVQQCLQAAASTVNRSDGTFVPAPARPFHPWQKSNQLSHLPADGWSIMSGLCDARH